MILIVIVSIIFCTVGLLNTHGFKAMLFWLFLCTIAYHYLLNFL